MCIHTLSLSISPSLSLPLTLSLYLSSTHPSLHSIHLPSPTHHEYHQLVDLPCIIESYKTLDSKTLYKTGDISQMLICAVDVDQLDLPATEGESLDEMTATKRKELSKKFFYNHGCKAVNVVKIARFPYEVASLMPNGSHYTVLQILMFTVEPLHTCKGHLGTINFCPL